MFKIVYKEELNDAVTLMKVEAPFIANKAKPGQFIIFRVDEKGERIPLTIADKDPEEGTVTIIFQKIGESTMLLGQLNEGDYILDFVGPLGNATEYDADKVKKVCIIGGGVGCAIAYPQAKHFFTEGVHTDMIAGFRSKDIVFMEDLMRDVSTNLYITTDDGTYGEKGFVTSKLQQLIDDGNEYDLVIAIGPIPMMKFVAEVTRPYNIKTLVSLNPIMIDGTGMCGGCRVTVGGEIKFACVDGPDFDAHEVDFDELMNRNAFYAEEETHAKDNCRLFTAKVDGGNE